MKERRKMEYKMEWEGRSRKEIKEEAKRMKKRGRYMRYRLLCNMKEEGREEWKYRTKNTFWTWRERKIGEWLEEREIEYECQKEFPGSRRRYDIYIPSKQVCIEEDGGHGWGNEGVDREKDEMCEMMGMRMIRIRENVEIRGLGDIL